MDESLDANVGGRVWTQRLDIDVGQMHGHRGWMQMVGRQRLDTEDWTQRLDIEDGRKGWTQRLDAEVGHRGWTQRLDTVGWTQRVDTEVGRRGWT